MLSVLLQVISLKGSISDKKTKVVVWLMMMMMMMMIMIMIIVIIILKKSKNLKQDITRSVIHKI